MDSDRNSPAGEAGVDSLREIRRSDWTEYEHPSTAVASAIAETTGQAQTDLAPLQASIDADALDALVGDPDADHVEVTFAYDDLEVYVTSNGVLEIRR